MKKKKIFVLSFVALVVIFCLYLLDNYKMYRFISKDDTNIYKLYENNNKFIIYAEREYFYAEEKDYANKIDQPVYANKYFLIYDMDNFEGLSMSEFENAKETEIKNDQIYFWIYVDSRKTGKIVRFQR
jgi:hypothetical protein